MKLDVQIDGDLAACSGRDRRRREGGDRRRHPDRQGAQGGLASQVTGAGLGQRLANTIRANRYPRSGESINAASLVFSRAPKIVDAFDRGALIRSKHGFYLAIPTAEAGTGASAARGSLPAAGSGGPACGCASSTAPVGRACSSPTTPGSTPAASPRPSAAAGGATGC